ncbi:4262_t:CDS:2 [Funneliformis caledonium]|uniref:4262_t:CDS:1 n=1 Tax=Funneliformis caledonium TaxID=1117310 RepID=A0A9N8W914_9GLOM|nr:4262_t:CDS:2 [Funneliformis caledonium]
MSEPSKIKYILDEKSPNVFVLDIQTKLFMDIKISSPEEIMRRCTNREYKDLKNSYMVFMIDCREAFNASAKTNKKLRQIADFKNPPSLWRNSPKKVKAAYEKVFMGYKKLVPKVHSFVQYLPQGTNEDNEDDNEPIENTEQVIVPPINDPTLSPEGMESIMITGHGSSYTTDTLTDDLATTSTSVQQINNINLNESYYVLSDWEHYLYSLYY